MKHRPPSVADARGVPVCLVYAMACFRAGCRRPCSVFLKKRPIRKLLQSFLDDFAGFCRLDDVCILPQERGLPHPGTNFPCAGPKPADVCQRYAIPGSMLRQVIKKTHSAGSMSSDMFHYAANQLAANFISAQKKCCIFLLAQPAAKLE